MIDALFDLLGTFYQSGNFEQAEWIARSILQAIPDDIVSLQFLGLLYHRTRRRAQAMQVFAATTAGDAPASAVPPGLGDSSLPASAQCRRAASARGSTLAGAWYDLGRLLLRLGHDRQAIDALQAAIAAQPDLHKARRTMAQITRNSGRQEAPAPEVGTDGSRATGVSHHSNVHALECVEVSVNPREHFKKEFSHRPHGLRSAIEAQGRAAGGASGWSAGLATRWWSVARWWPAGTRGSQKTAREALHRQEAPRNRSLRRA